MRIHKFSLVPSLLLVLCSLTQGQIVRGFGVKLGACTATELWGRDQYDYRWGVDVGGYVEWLDVPVVSILSEVHYVQKGMSYRFYTTPAPLQNGTWNSNLSTPRIDYLSIPLLAKFRSSIGQVEGFLTAGPRIDILLTQDGDGWPLFAQNGKTSIGATIGAGIQTSFASSMVVGVEVRYSPTFTSTEIEGWSVKNKSFEMLVSVGK